jgi:hypothetical protein
VGARGEQPEGRRPVGADPLRLRRPDLQLAVDRVLERQRAPVAAGEVDVEVGRRQRAVGAPVRAAVGGGAGRATLGGGGEHRGGQRHCDGRHTSYPSHVCSFEVTSILVGPLRAL